MKSGWRHLQRIQAVSIFHCLWPVRKLWFSAVFSINGVCINNFLLPQNLLVAAYSVQHWCSRTFHSTKHMVTVYGSPHPDGPHLQEASFSAGAVYLQEHVYFKTKFTALSRKHIMSFSCHRKGIQLCMVSSFKFFGLKNNVLIVSVCLLYDFEYLCF